MTVLTRVKDDDDNRWYTKNETLDYNSYIGVTSVLDCAVPKTLKKYFVNNTKEKQEKRLFETADLGTAIHNEIEADLKGVGLESPREDVAPAMLAWKTWRESNEVKTVQTETMIHSDKYGFAGTFDFLAEVNGQLYLGDIKTGFFNVKAGWQLMAYKVAAMECGLLDDSCKLMGVSVPRDGGPVKPFIYEHETWLQDSWFSCFQVWKALYFTKLNKLGWTYLKTKTMESKL